jgi:hypothetical protein
LISGLGFEDKGTATSEGPVMYAYAPWQHSRQPPPNGTKLDAIELVCYPHGNALPENLLTDQYGSGAWISSGTKNAVIITSSKASSVRYGNALPGDCNQSHGYHGAPFHPEILFYDPDDLAAAARGEMEPWDIQPYEKWNPQQYLYDNCDWFISGAVFDDVNGYLYFLQPNGDYSTSPGTGLPVISVFKINQSSAVNTARVRQVHKKKLEISALPGTRNGSLKFRVQTAHDGDFTVKIHDVNGRQVWRRSFQNLGTGMQTVDCFVRRVNGILIASVEQDRRQAVTRVVAVR